MARSEDADDDDANERGFMIQATQLKRGMCIKHDNGLFRVVTTHHITPGNWRGMVQTKIRNLKTGSISDHRFRSVDMVERAILDETQMEYLYQDGDMYHFMNNESFEQIGISAETLAPLMAGSVSMTFMSTVSGSSMPTGRPSHMSTFSLMFGIR